MSYRPQAPAAQLPPASLKSLSPAILGPRRWLPPELPTLYPEPRCWRRCCISTISRAAVGSKIVLKNKAITSTILWSHRRMAVSGPGLSVIDPMLKIYKLERIYWDFQGCSQTYLYECTPSASLRETYSSSPITWNWYYYYNFYYAIGWYVILFRGFSCPPLSSEPVGCLPLPPKRKGSWHLFLLLLNTYTLIPAVIF